MKFIRIIFILFSPLIVWSQTSIKSINSKSNFDIFAGLPLSEKYGQVSAVKLVYDLNSKELFFINSKYYKFHFEFCVAERNVPFDLDSFNQDNYSDKSNRNFLLANINYFKSIGKYILEISPADLMPDSEILKLYKISKENTFIGDSLYFILNSSRLLNNQSFLDKTIKTITPSDIFNNLDYQAIGKHKKSGKLHFIEDIEKEKSEIKSTDIIVINETPLFLPNVAGVIVTEFQTPLSHLSILGQNRRIPIMAYKRAFKDSVLLKLNNENVNLDVQSESYIIQSVNNLTNKRTLYKPIKLLYNLKVDSVIDIKYLNRQSYKFAGNKASNFSILYRLSKKNKFKVPENAFVIPFYFYNKHINESKTKKTINELINMKDSTQDKEIIESKLQKIRKLIIEFPLDSSLLKSVNKKILSHPEYTRMKFRSSTNAEDAKGFSGAGLYESKSGNINDNEKSYEKAIKTVWASLWSYNAFMEREYFHINHSEAFMGILVHRSFPNEEVNGVAITKNIYRKDDDGFVINTQLGNEKVVKPQKNTVTEQLICYPKNADNLHTDKNTIDIITLSSLNGGKLLMSEEEIQNLATQLEIIKKHFYKFNYSKVYWDFGLDIEFKFDGSERKLYFKQVRIYND